MAGTLNIAGYRSQFCYQSWLWALLFSVAATLVTACGDSTLSKTPVLTLPERDESVYITDQASLAGKALSLWDEEGQCTLKWSVLAGNNKQTGAVSGLAPVAPCYFIKSPGTQNAQVFRQDKTTRIVAVLGTPVTGQDSAGKRCGRKVQGVIISGRGKIRLSEYVLQGAVYCAENGLENSEYVLF